MTASSARFLAWPAFGAAGIAYVIGIALLATVPMAPATLGLWIRKGRPSALGAGSPVVTEFASRGTP